MLMGIIYCRRWDDAEERKDPESLMEVKEERYLAGKWRDRSRIPAGRAEDVGPDVGMLMD